MWPTRCKKIGIVKFQMPNTNNAGRRLLRLPMHTNIKLSHIKKISKTISDFFKVKSSTI